MRLIVLQLSSLHGYSKQCTGKVLESGGGAPSRARQAQLARSGQGRLAGQVPSWQSRQQRRLPPWAAEGRWRSLRLPYASLAAAPSLLCAPHPQERQTCHTK